MKTTTIDDIATDRGPTEFRSLRLLKDSFNPKSAAHAALYPVGVATAGILGGAQHADAAIIYGSGPVVVTSSGATWDIDGDSDIDMTFGNTMGLGSPHFCITSSGTNAGWADYTGTPSPGTGIPIPLQPVEAATSIGPSNSFTHFQCHTLADINCNRVNASGFRMFPEFLGQHFWSFGAPAAPALDFAGTLGFQFDNNGTVNYGVANFVVSSLDGVSPSMTFTITDWAFDDSGAAISGSALNGSAAIPEVSGNALLAFVCLTGALLNRRRAS